MQQNDLSHRFVNLTEDRVYSIWFPQLLSCYLVTSA